MVYQFNNKTFNIINKEDILYVNDQEIKDFFFLDQETFDSFCFSEKYPNDSVSSFYDYDEDIISYHDLNLVFIIGLEMNKEFVKNFYLFCKKNNLKINFIPYLKDEIEILFLDVNKKYDEMLLTIDKINNKQVYNYRYFKNLDIFKCRNLILEIKNKYHYDEDFAQEKDEYTFLNIIDTINGQKGSLEEKASQYLFYIINDKPFIKGNEEIACFLVLDFLNINRAITKKGNFLIEPSDFTYAISLINNSNNKEETLKKIRCLFIGKKKQNNLDELFEILKIDSSEDNVINYLVKYIENFYGCQGYYEYYNSKCGCLKIHYHGEYNYFKLNIGKTIASNNTLYFDCIATCYMEAPFYLTNRDKVIASLFEEIKVRSYEDVINDDLKKNLLNKLKPFYDLNQINIEFNIKWKLDVDVDYIF
ncbi:putative uncharacterized protein [Firmicutes bacterium CAG:449]|nr:putative uncharacterized protein [Firmicutes bacterium CAG:449]